jgi:hypothetical protein
MAARTERGPERSRTTRASASIRAAEALAFFMFDLIHFKHIEKSFYWTIDPLWIYLYSAELWRNNLPSESKDKPRESTMKKIAILALAVMAITQLAGAVELSGSFADIKTKSDSLNKPILMEFFAEW